ncbi:MAG: 4-hydroxy-tetrahydrodipicolinate synthase [Actinomycetota bacterium]|nr:4-hydroxy-tetrahydrodipicolinate synthase [Actinomycetota bacterium]
MGIALDQFGAVITAMVTAFDENEALDIDATVTLAKKLADDGNSALVVSGTTGEASTLTDPEKILLWETLSSELTIPIIAGSGSNETAHSITMTKHASEVGVAGILAVAPYYNRPPQSGIYGHFNAMAKATSLPVFVYDIPVRTGRKVAGTTLMKVIADNSNVVALKDAAGDPAATASLIPQLPSYFDVYSGDDSLTLPLLSVGAVGVIGVATHWATDLFREMIEAFSSGDVKRAIEVNQALLASYDYETGEAAPNPIPTKVMMNYLGLSVGGCRLPMGDAPAGHVEVAKRVADELASFRSKLIIK